ncbi:hypothetical protein VitviT2T_006394 [Vitis vinifera]|uniref:HMA domain-containing protein n=1 Tax=Vitis vinifera TaxID=29760 RepID=A0ABY9BVW5_VITVI|nr:heavy metal-associated isoprenylated plant protein 19 [Vitis vinifera]WJZ86985.1 hypothetical protein VitviT2T_006394 [Vitis vinifera]|eukprot:XP_002277023.1 PREDICTED: heavy metal-associated isoprenylated plant protein 19 [Vitis vinifera]
MANDKEKNEEKVVVAEFSVSMHCNACERSVAKAISKCKGVEKFTTDMKKHKATVRGAINPEKILKKLKKKTGKRVEILVTEEEKDDESSDDDESRENTVESLISWDWTDSAAFEMFNEENANACSVM